MCKSCEVAGEETCIIPECCAFIKNSLFIIPMHHKKIRTGNISASDVYPLMEKLRKNVSQRKEHM
jgi:tRNA(Leu) C34 or U34 (ribose-2'-O)-methylase TrmL